MYKKVRDTNVQTDKSDAIKYIGKSVIYPRKKM